MALERNEQALHALLCPASHAPPNTTATPSSPKWCNLENIGLAQLNGNNPAWIPESLAASTARLFLLLMVLLLPLLLLQLPPRFGAVLGAHADD